MSEERLNRIEAKLDKLTDYIVEVARLDERITNLEDVCEVKCHKFDKNEKLLNDLALTVKNFVRVFWLLLSSFVISSVSYYFSHHS